MNRVKTLAAVAVLALAPAAAVAAPKAPPAPPPGWDATRTDSMCGLGKPLAGGGWFLAARFAKGKAIGGGAAYSAYGYAVLSDAWTSVRDETFKVDVYDRGFYRLSVDGRKSGNLVVFAINDLGNMKVIATQMPVSLRLKVKNTAEIQVPFTRAEVEQAFTWLRKGCDF